MRRFVSLLALATTLGLGAVTASIGAPVSGFETQYDQAVTSCTLPAGTVALCDAAINGYSGALVPNVDQVAANQSFTSLRSQVFVANESDKLFQADIDILFETLLPDSGAINAAPNNAPEGLNATPGDSDGPSGVSSSPN